MRHLLAVIVALTACSVDSDNGGDDDEDGGQVSGTPVQPEPEHRTCDEIVECLLKEPVTCAGLDEEPYREDAEEALLRCEDIKSTNPAAYEDCLSNQCE